VTWENAAIWVPIRGFRLSVSLDVSRLFPLSRAPYAPQRSRLNTAVIAPTRVVSLSLPRSNAGATSPSYSNREDLFGERPHYRGELTFRVVGR
jgi:hypothetical protein